MLKIGLKFFQANFSILGSLVFVFDVDVELYNLNMNAKIIR